MSSDVLSFCYTHTNTQTHTHTQSKHPLPYQYEYAGGESSRLLSVCTDRYIVVANACSHVDRETHTHSHTGDMVSARGTAVGQLSRLGLLLAPQRSAIGWRQQLSLSQLLTSPVCVRSSVPLLHEIMPSLHWDYLLPGARQQLKTMRMANFTGKPLWKWRVSQDWFGNYRPSLLVLFPFDSCSFHFPGTSNKCSLLSDFSHVADLRLHSNSAHDLRFSPWCQEKNLKNPHQR